MCNFAGYLIQCQPMQKINLFLPFVLILTFSVSTLANNDTIPEKNKSLEIHASYTGDILTNVVGGTPLTPTGGKEVIST